MPTVLDQSVVFGEFNDSIPADIVASLRAHITGPVAELHRYTVNTEKINISLGEYDPDTDTDYDWPDKSDGAIVDLDYARVYIDDALLQYFQDLKNVDDTIEPVAGYKNRIVTDAANGWKKNGAYARNAALKDRDVAVGDIVYLKDGADDMWTSVAGLIATPVAASIGSSSADDANLPSQPNSNPGSAPTVSATGGGIGGGSLQAGDYYVRYSFVGDFGETWASNASSVFTVSAGNIPRVTIPALPTGADSANIYLSPTDGAATECTLYLSSVAPTTVDLEDAYAPGGADYPKKIEQTAGTVNNVAANTVSSASYDGLADGDITETYTIVVTQASTGGNATTARLRVTSASGRDDQSSVTPSAFSAATSIGTRGLTVTWTTGSSHNFLIGQTWRITVRQEWDTPTHASGGTFTGTTDVGYIVHVTRGGLFADLTKPQISVTTAEGIDSSGPTNVTTSGGAVSIGTLGATIAFTGDGLRKGDFYYISVTGPVDGAYKTILLANNLTTALQASSDMDITLYIRKDIEVTEQRIDDPPAVNWVAAADALTIKSDITAYDSSLTDSGVAFAVPVKGGTIYAHYRAWKDDFAEEITEASTTDEVESLFGASTIHPDNPLAYAVYKAVQNSNGQPVLFTGVANPDSDMLWTDVLEILEGYTNIFSLVPLTRRIPILQAYRDHVIARSADEVGGEWRTAWFNQAAEDTTAIVDEATSADENVVMATLGDNPAVSGTQYTLLTVTSGNSNFVTNGVQAGDIVRYIYSIDEFGTATYQSFVVESVVNEETLVLESGPDSAVGAEQKVEVWRSLSKTQIASNLTASINDVLDSANSRFRFVWPDQIEDEDGQTVEGYFLCAALAGMVSGIAPHQGLRNISISGFSSANRSTSFFNNAQLNMLQEAGFVVVSALSDGTVYVRTARTPNPSSVATREEATTRLDDAIRYLFYNRIEGFFGKSNVTPSALALIDSELKAAIQHGMTDTRVDRIGPMISDGSVTTLRQHLTILDRIVVEMSVTRGFPLNDASILLVF